MCLGNPRSEEGEEEGGVVVTVHPCGSTPSDVVQARLDSVPKQEDPFYVVDLGRLVTLFGRWSSELPNVHPFYAVKCNNNPVILTVLAALGCGFDCASPAEIQSVLDLGVPLDRVLYANPCKQMSHIKFAASRSVLKMTFDNEFELRKISRCHPTAELLVRIRADDPDAICNLGAKFGVSVEQACHLLHVAMEMDLNVVGVCFHVGSGCQNASAYSHAIGLAHRVFMHGKSIGMDLSILDIGGGFPGHKGEEDYFSQVSCAIRDSLAKWFGGEDVTVIAEPGRYFAASTHTLAVCVTSKREECTEDGKKKFMYYVNDGVYGSFNCILYDHVHPVPRPLMPTPEGCDQYECSIWGPTCDGLDQVFEYGTLPELAVGAWVVFENMGAYTLCAASSFNGFQKPKTYYYLTEEHNGMEQNGGGVGSALETPAGPLDVHWLLQGMLGGSLAQQPQNSGHLCTD